MPQQQASRPGRRLAVGCTRAAHCWLGTVGQSAFLSLFAMLKNSIPNVIDIPTSKKSNHLKLRQFPMA
jgi:hypothetical protein